MTGTVIYAESSVSSVSDWTCPRFWAYAYGGRIGHVQFSPQRGGAGCRRRV